MRAGSKIVLETQPLGFPWVTADPFLFCVHHDDAYPAGNEQMGPERVGGSRSGAYDRAHDRTVHSSMW
nr:hypothetical protein [Polyangium spumosum]